MPRRDGALLTGADERSFPRERLVFLGELEGWHFWFDGRRQLVLRLLTNARLCPNTLLVDVGCGTGAMVSTLRSEGYRAIGIDPYVASAPIGVSAHGEPIVAADGLALPLADGSCGAIVTLDVLEHTDDQRMLREIHRALRPGGTLVLTVPALAWLWSHHDERAGHLRRYTAADLRRRVEAAGFVIDECHFYQFALLPLVAASRLRPRRTFDRQGAPERPTRMVNSLLTAVNRSEVFLGRWIKWPVGSTLALRCRKAV